VLISWGRVSTLERALSAIRLTFVSLKGLERTTGDGALGAGARYDGADTTGLGATGADGAILAGALTTGAAGLGAAMGWAGAALRVDWLDEDWLDELLARLLRSKTLPFCAKAVPQRTIKTIHAAPSLSLLDVLSDDMAVLLSSTLDPPGLWTTNRVPGYHYKAGPGPGVTSRCPRAYPFMHTRGSSLATFLARPAPWVASTTACTSL